MRMVISVGDRRVQVTIAWHRCGGWSSIIAAVIIGGLTGAWRSVLRGDATTGLTTALCDAVTVLRWPAVLVTLVFTVVAVGLDGDDHLEEVYRTVGERLVILRGCQALAGLTMSVLLLGVAILSSGLFGLFGGLREGSPLGACRDCLVGGVASGRACRVRSWPGAARCGQLVGQTSTGTGGNPARQFRGGRGVDHHDVGVGCRGASTGWSLAACLHWRVGGPHHSGEPYHCRRAHLGVDGGRAGGASGAPGR